MKKKILLLLFLVFLITGAKSQDHLYSQFYNSPNYLNPALNGQFDGDLRINMIYRSQWTNIVGPLAYYSLSIDYSIPRYGGGIGLLVTKSSEGTAYLSKTNASGIYSYSVTFENAVLSFGLQAGITNRKIDFNKLVFGDQIDQDGIIPGGITAASELQYNNRFFFDSGAGINLVWGNFMIGASGQHLNKPDETFTGSKSILPMRLNGHLSYKWNLDPYEEDESPALIPSVVYNTQANIRSVSAGIQFKRRGVNVGLWYRGDGKQHDAAVVSLILDLFVKKDYYDKVRFGFSHDAAISSLNYGKTAGTTEGALSYETTFPNRNSGAISYGSGQNYGKRCYDFY